MSTMQTMTPRRRQAWLAVAMLVLFLGTLGTAQVLIHRAAPRPREAETIPANGATPRVFMYLPQYPADFEPFDPRGYNLPLLPKVAMARNDNYSIRLLYVFVIPITDYREPGALEDSSTEFFHKLTGMQPGETLREKLAGRDAIELHQTSRNGVGFFWQRSTMVFDKLYVVFYTGNTGADERDDQVFRDTICGGMRLKVRQ